LVAETEGMPDGGSATQLVDAGRKRPWERRWPFKARRDNALATRMTIACPDCGTLAAPPLPQCRSVRPLTRRRGHRGPLEAPPGRQAERFRRVRRDRGG
jgi:hypothetical protein